MIMSSSLALTSWLLRAPMVACFRIARLPCKTEQQWVSHSSQVTADMNTCMWCWPVRCV